LNYERISIVVVLALLLFVGMGLIGEAGARPVPEEESSYKNEVSMLRAALEAAASKQSDRRKADTLAMIAILQDKRAAVMANEQAGYFVPRLAGIARSSPRTDHWRFPLSGDHISAGIARMKSTRVAARVAA
jgi:hypothetical protein